MNLIYTEKASRDRYDDSVFYVANPIYDLVGLYIDGVEYNTSSAIISERKVTLPIEVPEEAEILVTYLEVSGDCGSCLTLSAIRRDVYYKLYGTYDAEFDGFDTESINRYIKEGLAVIRNASLDHRAMRSYMIDIRVPPKKGMIMTDDGEFMEYDMPNGELVVDKQVDIRDKGFRYGFKLPRASVITGIKSVNKGVSFTQYRGYYFFEGCTDGIISVEYYPEIVLSEDCRVEFDAEYASLPALYALYNAQMDREDERWQLTKRKYDELLKQYRRSMSIRNGEHLRKGFTMMPERKYYSYNKYAGNTIHY